ncbi:hypothetical protein [Antarcticimicrobium sediminis]|uniref:Uncharacterized protein n=1 Tax=Antarcticimicrobium sediminis TaxID=2546227 RepID=A0A4R5EK52_9RHOB|nr:hypothetical protein [Antarcticimicrobium sediminis]TDE34663.1 hypothetical protein E1B25_19205 [Antarcticimicrobium sediminis]
MNYFFLHLRPYGSRDARIQAARRGLHELVPKHAAGDVAPAWLYLAGLDDTGYAGEEGGHRRFTPAKEPNKLGRFMCGSPATIFERLKEYQARVGFGPRLSGLQFGTLLADPGKNNMKLFAK